MKIINRLQGGGGGASLGGGGRRRKMKSLTWMMTFELRLE